MFPQTIEDYKELANNGKSVYYKETNTDVNQDGEGWELWGTRITDIETIYVWRKIDLIENANLYN